MTTVTIREMLPSTLRFNFRRPLLRFNKIRFSKSNESSNPRSLADIPKADSDSPVKILSGAVVILGGAVMIHGLNEYYEQIFMKDQWKCVSGRLKSLELQPVTTGRGFLGQEKRYNASAIYEYQDDSGKVQTGRFQSAVSSEGYIARLSKTMLFVWYAVPDPKISLRHSSAC